MSSLSIMNVTKQKNLFILLTSILYAIFALKSDWMSIPVTIHQLSSIRKSAWNGNCDNFSCLLLLLYYIRVKSWVGVFQELFMGEIDSHIDFSSFKPAVAPPAPAIHLSVSAEPLTWGCFKLPLQLCELQFSYLTALFHPERLDCLCFCAGLFSFSSSI